ncbi:MAG: hypothetical protein FWC98_00705 [Bacteroidales bacterium]|nr:hypothetical protein [Bacteroidales bacterium]
MEIPTILRRPWNISERSLSVFCENELGATLRAFNRAGNGNYYLMDFFRKKIIVASPFSLILCGFQKDLVVNKGLTYYQQIVCETEWEWLTNIITQMYEFFFLLPEHKRKDFVYAYDMTGITAKNERKILHHHVAPWKLCKNGNLWLALAHVWVSASKEAGSPTIWDKITGDQYHFISDQFVKVEKPSLDSEDLTILRWMVKAIPDKEMSELLSMSLSSFKRKKRQLFMKVGGNTSANVVHKAHLFGFM